MRRKLLTTAQEIVIYRGNCCLHRKLLFVQEIIIYTGNNHHVGNYYLHRKSLSRGKLLFAQKTIITRAENSYLRENYYLYRNYYYVRRKCSGETRQRKLLFPKGILLYIGNTPGETRQRKLLFTQEIIIYIGDTAPHRDTPERQGRGNYYLRGKLLFIQKTLRRDKAEDNNFLYTHRGRGNYYLHRKLLFTQTRQRITISHTHIEAEEIIIYMGNYYLHRQGRG